MGFYERILGIQDPRIPVHELTGMLSEFERGLVTRNQIIAAFDLSPSEQAELDALTPKVVGLPEAYSLGSLVTLANIGTVYDGTTATKGLGFVAVDASGITRLEARIRYNKIGTGILSWQLWNETEGQEIGIFDDANAAGDNRTASIIVTPAAPLSGGVKLLRIRAKSTVAADDPVYYGSCIFLRRIARLAGQDIHEILMLASGNIAPYNNIITLKARLGVS